MPGLITRPGTPGTADQKRVVNTKVVKRILGENAYRESANKAWKEANSAKGSDVLERCRQLNAYLSKEFLTGTHGSETDSDSDSDISKGSSATDSDIELDEEPLTSPKPARPKPAVKAVGKAASNSTPQARPGWQSYGLAKAPSAKQLATQKQQQQQQQQEQRQQEEQRLQRQQLKLAEQRLLTQRTQAALVVQRSWRGACVRRVALALRAEQQRQLHASSCIQAHWRGYIAEKALQQWRSLCTQAAVCIQRHVRGCQARRRCAALRRAQHAQQGRCSTSGSSRSDGSSRHGHSKRGSRPGTSSGISARDLGSVRIRCVSELGLAQSSQLKDSLGLLESVVSPAAFDALCRAHQRAEDIQDSERLQHVLLNDRVHQLTAWGQLSRPGSAQAPSHRMTVASS